MGSRTSSEEKKTVDTTGNVNNNVVIQEPVPVETQEIVILLSIITTIKIFELLIFLYKQHVKGIKKKFDKNPSPA